jgi:hypothetical protein
MQHLFVSDSGIANYVMKILQFIHESERWARDNPEGGPPIARVDISRPECYRPG